MKPHPARGLTLLELAIVLAVLATLVALAVPTFAARLNRERLSVAAETLAADLTEARFLAAQRGRTLHLQMRAGDDWCWSIAQDTACDCAQAQACQLRRVPASAHRRVQLLESQAVALAPDGTSTPQRVATLAIAAGDRLGVDILALGRTRICVAGGDSTRYPPC